MVATHVLSGGIAVASVANTTQFWWLGTVPSRTTTETQAQTIFREAGTLSNMLVLISSNSTTVTITSRKNALAGAQTISVGASATGSFEDTTNKDTVIAGDKLNVRTVPGTTGTFTMPLYDMIYKATAETTTVTKCIWNDEQTARTRNTTNFITINGVNFDASATTTTEANFKYKMKEAGTFKNMWINVNANGIATASTMTFRKNGLDGTLTISITGSTTGFFEDTTHSDSVVIGDDVNYKLITAVGSGTQTIAINLMGSDFQSTQGLSVFISQKEAAVTLGFGTTVVQALGGVSSALTETTQASLKSRISNIGLSFSNMTANIRANTVNGATTVSFRKNAANGNQTVSITASTTGEFIDTTNTDSVISTDLINYRMVAGGTSGTMTIQYQAVYYEPKTIQTVFVEFEEA